MTQDITRIRGPFPWAQDAEYAQAVVSNGLVHISGQYGANDHGDVVSDDFRAQAVRTFENLGQVLEAAGADVDDLIQLRCFLLRGQDYPIFKEVRRSFLRGTIPSITLLCVPAFAFPGMLVEVEAVARLSQ